MITLLFKHTQLYTEQTLKLGLQEFRFLLQLYILRLESNVHTFCKVEFVLLTFTQKKKRWFITSKFSINFAIQLCLGSLPSHCAANKVLHICHNRERFFISSKFIINFALQLCLGSSPLHQAWYQVKLQSGSFRPSD